MDVGQEEKRPLRDSTTTELVLNTYRDLASYGRGTRGEKAPEGQYND